jgi:hypothetical protein
MRHDAGPFTSRRLRSAPVARVGHYMQGRWRFSDGGLRRLCHRQQTLRVVLVGGHLLCHDQAAGCVHRRLHVVRRLKSLPRLHQARFRLAMLAQLLQRLGHGLLVDRRFSLSGIILLDLLQIAGYRSRSRTLSWLLTAANLDPSMTTHSPFTSPTDLPNLTNSPVAHAMAFPFSRRNSAMLLWSGVR